MKPEGNPVHEVGQELSLRICTRVYLPQPATVGPLYIILLHFDIQISNRKVHHCLRGPAAVSSQHKVGHQGDVP
jgi:hypothetical protein